MLLTRALALSANQFLCNGFSKIVDQISAVSFKFSVFLQKSFPLFLIRKFNDLRLRPQACRCRLRELNVDDDGIIHAAYAPGARNTAHNAAARSKSCLQSTARHRPRGPGQGQLEQEVVAEHRGREPW